MPDEQSEVWDLNLAEFQHPYIGFDNGEVQTVSDDEQRGPAEGRAEPFGTCTMGFLLMLEAKLNTSKNI